MKKYQAPEMNQISFVAEQDIATVAVTIGSLIHNDVELAW